MAEAVKMPRLSDTMSEGVIQAWHKKVGDSIKLGDIVAEIETDKAVMEFESFQEGTLLYIAGEVGKAIKVDDVIAIIGKPGEDYKALLSAAPAAAPVASAPVPAVNTPAPTPAPAATSTPAPASAPAPAPIPAANNQEGSRLKASPLAKKIAEDKGIDISRVSGSGDDGRIVKRDVEAAANAPAQKGGYVPAAAVGTESFEEVNVSQMRKTIARRLAESKFSSPEFYLTISINMDNCVSAREGIIAAGGPKVSYNDLVIKAASLALRQHPKVNSYWMTDKIRYNHHVHMGVAVAVEDGLLVPVIRFADSKSLSQINAEVKELAGKAKERKLQPQEMEGNTFTISNLGMFDIDEFTAIINPPSSCIMAIGRMAEAAVVIDGDLTVAHIMKVTLTCDHRTVDGATGAQFLNTFKQLLENPMMMLV